MAHRMSFPRKCPRMSISERFESLVAECKQQVITTGHVVPVIIVGFNDYYKVLPIIVSKERKVKDWIRRASSTFPEITEMWITQCATIIWKEDEKVFKSHAIVIFYGNSTKQQIWTIPYVKRDDIYYFKKPLTNEQVLFGDLKEAFEELSRVFRPIGVV